ncbi:hypothetical protein [Paenibacillus polymyxa]|uniref:hypothetical protein n=1 Tax=Paenibacillus polymyxa TaxID=1406 RepID=UPI000378BD62|nr:hypothetical protein [Paenibacillus polymyxa]NMP10488.1 hypothetical protein [Paenibacillus polymyxa]
MSKKFMVTVLTFFLISIILLPSATHAATLNKTVEGMLGFSPPTGTTAKGSTTWYNLVASNAIDGSIKTTWNTGGELEILS